MRASSGIVRTGAWAQQIALRTDQLAELPDGVSFAQAATLPVAGLTALRGLEIAGFVLGKRVLVTGAAGGVGRFAVQLAAGAGAHVTAVARNAERARGLRELGADEVVFDLDGEGTFHAILEGVGGASLGAAMGRVAPRGTVVSYASSDASPVSFGARTLFGRAPGAVLRGLFIFEELERTGTATERPRPARCARRRGPAGLPDRPRGLVARARAGDRRAAGPPRRRQGRAARRLTGAPLARAESPDERRVLFRCCVSP